MSCLNAGMRVRTSKIWVMPLEEFRSIVEASKSYAAILRAFGFAITGSGLRSVRKRCQEEGVSVTHIPVGLNSNRGREFQKTATPLSNILVEFCSYDRGNLKRRLLKDGLLKNECRECGQLPYWNGKILVMVLDHINGVRDDNRLWNLQLLCPNCNSQTKTFSGRNRGAVV